MTSRSRDIILVSLRAELCLCCRLRPAPCSRVWICGKQTPCCSCSAAPQSCAPASWPGSSAGTNHLLLLDSIFHSRLKKFSFCYVLFFGCFLHSIVPSFVSKAVSVKNPDVLTKGGNEITFFKISPHMKGWFYSCAVFPFIRNGCSWGRADALQKG